MKIKVKEYCQMIEKRNYDLQSVNIKSKNDIENIELLSKLMSAFYIQFKEDLKSNFLSKINIMINLKKELDICFSIETGIINLPWEDNDKLIDFFESDDNVIVNIYFIIKTPLINVSGFRIDKIMSVSEYLENPLISNNKLNDLIQFHFKELIKND